MTELRDYFEIKEVVCPHAYDYYLKKLGYSEARVWAMFDPRLVANMLWLREALGRPITINTWSNGGRFSQRGIRCNLCDIVQSKTAEGKPYLSAHPMGQGFDFDVEGMTAEEVRQWIIEHQDEMPYAVRLEMKKTWVHMDVVDVGVKVYKLYV